jgi:hypothetical protein
MIAGRTMKSSSNLVNHHRRVNDSMMAGEVTTTCKQLYLLVR